MLGGFIVSNIKQHFKMYKKGKKWLVAGIATSFLVLGAGNDLVGHADTETSTPATNDSSAEQVTATPAATKTVPLKGESASTATTSVNQSSSTSTPTVETQSAAGSDASSATSETNAQSDTSATSAVSSDTASEANSNQSQSSAHPTETEQSDSSEVGSAQPAADQSTASTVTSAAADPESVKQDDSANNSATTNNINQIKAVTPMRMRALAQPVTKAAAETIDQWMPNKTLQTAILNALNNGEYGKTWASVADIQQSDLALLTRLDMQAYSFYIDGKSSFSLAGLQYATNLTYLDLLNNLNTTVPFRGDITDISPLAALKNLTYLQLVGQRVSDVTPLANLTKLVDLNLSNNEIDDFSSLNAAQYTKYFYYGKQVVEKPAAYIPVTGKYTLVSPVKPPKGVTFHLDAPVNGLAVYIIPENQPNPTLKLYYNGGEATLTGDQLSFQVMKNQIMPGPASLPGYTVIQNPYTYYMMAVFLDESGNNVAQLFIPYIVANYAKDVTVNYVDEQGNALAPSETLSGLIGENYTATAKTFTGYQLGDQPTIITGAFSDVEQTVNFVYKMAYSTVTVHYQNASGQTIKPDATVTSQIGTDFAIDHPSILGYTYASTQGEATGTYGDQPTEVTFIYNAAYSVITVHYQNAAGDTIQASTTVTGQIGTDYAIDYPTILGYTYDSTQGNATGTYWETPTTIVFIYKEAYSTVTAHYVDLQGRSIRADEVLTGQVGTDFNVNYPEILGYTYQTTQGATTGTYGETPLTVTFVYQAAYSSVLVHYQTTDGQPIQPDATITGQIGTDYQLKAPTLLGYKYQSTQGNANGTYGDTPAEVTFIYTVAKSTVTVHYQDAAGKSLQADTVLTGQVGSSYQVTAPTLSGYRYQSTQGNATGTYGETPIEVTFIYDQAHSTVTVHYQDEAGQTLQADTVLTGQVGSTYQLTVPDIDGYTYLATRAQTSGVYGETPIEMTFVYRVNAVTPPVVTPDQVTTVTVHYVTEDGTQLAADKLFTGKPGDAYTTAAATISGYQLIAQPTNASGTLGTDDFDVTYVYEPATDTGVGDQINPGDGDDVDLQQPEPGKPGTKPTAKQPVTSGQPTTEALAARITPTAKAQVGKVKLQPASTGKTPAATPHAAATLPQTDEIKTSPAWGLAILGSLLGLAGLKRRRHN